MSAERCIVTKNNKTAELTFNVRGRNRSRWRTRQSGPDGHSTGEGRPVGVGRARGGGRPDGGDPVQGSDRTVRGVSVGEEVGWSELVAPEEDAGRPKVV